jgi:hypothetical protein
MAADGAEESAMFEKNSAQRKQRATQTKENICMSGAHFFQ